jgi:hypothetical protein
VWIVLGAAALVVVGLLMGLWLGRSANPPESTNPPQPYHYSIDQLSPLGAKLEDLDAGRVSLAPPASWHPESRRNEYLARFRLDRTQVIPLPRITVEVREAQFQQPANATEQNLGELLERIHATLGERTVQALKEPPQQLVVGDVPCIRYLVRRGFSVSRGAGSAPQTYAGEREVVLTLAGGRIYSVILDAYEGKADDYRGDLFAVVASLRFQQPAESRE